MSRASSSRPPTLAADPELAELAERIPLDVPELVLGRRVVPDGPTRSYLQGRSVSAQELRAVASRMVAFFGQHEHRRLMVASAQLDDPGRVLRRGAPEGAIRVRTPPGGGPRSRARADRDACAARRAGARPRLPRVRDRGDRGRRPGRGRGARPGARARPAGRGGDASPRRLRGVRGDRSQRDGLARWDGAAGGRGRAAARRRATATRRSARSHPARRRSCTSWRTSLPSCAPTWPRSRRTRAASRSSRSASSSSRG